MEIHILQGERPMARDNKSLGRFHLGGIPPMPARTPQIEVTFDIDANGILNVTAQEKGTGSKQSITITGSGNLSRNDIDRMVQDAEMNAEADRQAQELIELRNRAESLAYQTEKFVKDSGDKVDEATRQSVTEKVEAVRNAVKGEDMDAIQRAYDELEQESHAVAQRIYQASEATSSATTEEEPSAGVGASQDQDGDVMDAEFREEK